MNNQIISHLNTLFEQANEANVKTSKILESTSSDLWELEAQKWNLNEQIKIVRAVYQAAIQADTAAQEFKTKIEILLEEQNRI